LTVIIFATIIIIVNDNKREVKLMAQDQADLLAHPVRVRIILALGQNREMSAQQLGETLRDIPQATLYRHLQKLLAGGILYVARERQARGAVERIYALREGAASISLNDVAAMSREELLRLFTTFMGVLLGDFSRYVRRDDLDVVADRLSLRQVPLYMNAEELDQLIARVMAALEAVAANGPAPGRRRYLYTLIRFPVDDKDGGEATRDGARSPDEEKVMAEDDGATD
jgi:DNA-binding transcriptional ArsR family regulator